jgi:hypothetical protein
MDQFIREVDEEYRRERAAEIWRRYSALIVGVALAVVAGVGGWRYYEHREEGRAQEAASRYEDALRLSREAKPEEAEKTLSALASDAPSGYRLLARFRLAAEQGRQAPLEGAKAYDALAADVSVDGAMRDLARLRAAMLRADTPEAAAADRDLERLATPTNPWRHTARELLGLSGLKRGEFEAAGRWFDQIAADRESPQGLRSRLEIYTALVAGGPIQTTQ